MRETTPSVMLGQIIKELNLTSIYAPDNTDQVEVISSEVHRPGLQIIGFFDYFDQKRLQIIGKVENTYLANMNPEDRFKALDRLFSYKFPAAIVTRHMEPCAEMVEVAKKHGVPLLRTDEASSRFMSSLITSLNVSLAPRLTLHGVLVEIYGEGLLIIGDSGVGKSETAVELLKRGHRLVADDAVEIKRVSDKTLIGSSPAVIRHFIEIRGIGIINVKNLFGMGAVKDTEKIDLVVEFEPWRDNIEYERLGIETNYHTILDVPVPAIKVPVKQGRNLAVIMEVAAMNNRQKKMGYNAAIELNTRVMDNMAGKFEDRRE